MRHAPFHFIDEIYVKTKGDRMSETLRRQISSPGALIAFEAAARLGSFGNAATELNVTQPSISYQVKNLEKHIGTQLFERRGRAVALTEEGKILFRAVERGFAEIQVGLAQIAQRANEHLVTLCVSSSAAAHFLLPRHPVLSAALPDVDLSLKIMSRDINPAAENADFAIRLGHGDWEDLTAWRLFDEVYFPLCAPDFFEGRTSGVSLDELKGRNLLFLRERFRSRDDWKTFFAEAGAPALNVHARMTFSDQQTLLQAAVAGQGIGLGWMGMTDGFLNDGSLINPTGIQIRTDRAFYLVTPKSTTLTATAERFRDWILAQGAEIQARVAEGDGAA